MPTNPLDLVVEERQHQFNITVFGRDEHAIAITFSLINTDNVNPFTIDEFMWLTDVFENNNTNVPHPNTNLQVNVFNFTHEIYKPWSANTGARGRQDFELVLKFTQWVYDTLGYAIIPYSHTLTCPTVFVDTGAHRNEDYVPIYGESYANTNIPYYSHQDDCAYGFVEHSGSEQGWFHIDDSVFDESYEEYYINSDVALSHNVTYRECCDRYWGDDYGSECCHNYGCNEEGSPFDYTTHQKYEHPSTVNMSKLSGIQYTYGVEIETANSSDVEPCDSINWKAVHDGSTSGLEFVSGVMHGNKGLENLSRMCEKLQDATVDKRCGLHVHIGGAIFNRRFSIMIAKLCKQIEDDIFAILPPSRQDNSYCTKLPQYVDEINFKNYREKLGELIMNTKINRDYNKKKSHPGGHYNSQRYYWLNMTNYSCANGPDTVEFRCHGATTNYDKIYMWILICMSIVKFAENQQRRIWMSGISERATITLRDVIRYSLNDEHYTQVWEHCNKRAQLFGNKLNR